MNVIDELLKTIVEGLGAQQSIQENLNLYRADFTVNKLRNIDKEAVSKAINTFPSRDEIVVHLTAQNGPQCTFSLPRELDDLIANIGLRISSLKIEIDKKEEGGHLSLYNITHLLNTLTNRRLKNA